MLFSFGLSHTKKAKTWKNGASRKVEQFLCHSVQFAYHSFNTLSAPAMTMCLDLFLNERQVFVTLSLLERKRTLGVRMSVRVWRPLLFSAVVIWRISTYFLGAINLQDKEKSSSFLTFVLSELCQLYCKESLFSRI